MMNRMLAAVVTTALLALVTVPLACQSTGPVTENPKATPAQNWATLRAVVTLEENTVVAMHEAGHLEPAVKAFVVPIVAKQRQRLDATATADWMDLIEYVGYIPLVFDGVEVATIVANAPNLTPEEIESIKAKGIAADAAYDKIIK